MISNWEDNVERFVLRADNGTFSFALAQKNAYLKNDFPGNFGCWYFIRSNRCHYVGQK